jgi:methyl-accepting chemotaxis protein
MALFCAGMVDAFHTLAADRLIPAVADNRSLIPFTWAISRTFNAVILIVGAGIFLIWDRPVDRRDQRGDLRFLLATSGVFLLLSYLVVHFCAASSRLPQTMFPDSLITRPWDVGPLILFLLAGFVVFPLFHRKYPSLFSLALIVSIIPQVATQLHMSFGSTALYDNHFHVAHFLKIIAYLVPLGGLILDYRQTYEDLHQQTLRTRQVVVELSEAGSQIAGATEQQAAGTAEQVAALQETATTMNEIRQSGKHISERASQLGTTAEAASTAGKAGIQAMQETTHSMESIQEQVRSLSANNTELNEKTRSIGDIITTANAIAEQTKMLALNATIEAARASVAGSGFSVVAKQMKNLADEAKESTVRVRSILEDIQRGIRNSALLTEEAVNRADSGRQLTETAERTIRELTDAVHKSLDAFQEIVASTNEQQSGIEEVTGGMKQVHTAAEQASASTDQVKQAATNLNTLAQQLQSIVEN